MLVPGGVGGVKWRHNGWSGCWAQICAGGDLGVIRMVVELVLQALIDGEATEVIGAEAL